MSRRIKTKICWLGAARRGLSHWHLLNGPHVAARTLVQVPDGTDDAIRTGSKSSMRELVAALDRVFGV